MRIIKHSGTMAEILKLVLLLALANASPLRETQETVWSVDHPFPYHVTVLEKSPVILDLTTKPIVKPDLYEIALDFILDNTTYITIIVCEHIPKVVSFKDLELRILSEFNPKTGARVSVHRTGNVTGSWSLTVSLKNESGYDFRSNYLFVKYTSDPAGVRRPRNGPVPNQLQRYNRNFYLTGRKKVVFDLTDTKLFINGKDRLDPDRLFLKLVRHEFPQTFGVMELDIPGGRELTVGRRRQVLDSRSANLSITLEMVNSEGYPVRVHPVVKMSEAMDSPNGSPAWLYREVSDL